MICADMFELRPRIAHSSTDSKSQLGCSALQVCADSVFWKVSFNSHICTGSQTLHDYNPLKTILISNSNYCTSWPLLVWFLWRWYLSSDSSPVWSTIVSPTELKRPQGVQTRPSDNQASTSCLLVSANEDRTAAEGFGEAPVELMSSVLFLGLCEIPPRATSPSTPSHSDCPILVLFTSCVLEKRLCSNWVLLEALYKYIRSVFHWQARARRHL